MRKIKRSAMFWAANL